ncbi:MAG: iron-containing alcohol dehydrogenase [Anaerolineales bacterium]|nr:iron-containing alcohol dehydrogenase [Anaerolineales bacterium]
MTLRFDPGSIERFKTEISAIPGYPAGEALPIRDMVFESGAVFRLPELLTLAGADPAQPLLVVLDDTVMRRAGDELKPLILNLLRQGGWAPESLVLAPDATGQVHTDFAQIGRVKERLQPNLAVLSVGSGAVTDIAKHACFMFQQEHGLAPLPFVVYQTANSVSAYTSNMAPTFVDGVKRTLASRYPDVLVCDLETLRDAPYDMTAAGVGDLLAAFGSYADWWLACRLGIDPSYTEFAQTLMGPLDEIFLDRAEAIRSRSLHGMADLAKLIALGGLAMSLSHATAPLSGYEHVISHVLDLTAERAHRPLAQHGSQVALATLLTTAAYRGFLRQFDPARVVVADCYPTEAEMKARIEAAFSALDPSGQVAAECWSDYRLKLAAWHDQRATFKAALDDWPQVRSKLAALTRPPELARRILESVSAPLRFDQLTPPPSAAEVRFAFAHAPLIRRRLTLGDLPVFLGWDPETWWAQVSAETAAG